MAGLAFQANAADDGGRAEIEKQYARANHAAELKFVDGVTCCRSDHFVGYTLEGLRSDERLERAQLAKMFSLVLSVKDKTSILTFKETGKDRIACQVQDILEIVMPATLPKPANVVTYTLISNDEWAKEGPEWKITSSRTVKSSSTSHPRAGVPESTPSPTGAK